MATIKNPPPPRSSYIPRGPDPGTVNITRSRTTKPGWHIRVGVLHIGRRHIDPSAYHVVCQICGHPYDHNGSPHSIWQAERRMQGKPDIKRGESLTGPDGNIYHWNGTVWYRK